MRLLKFPILLCLIVGPIAHGATCAGLFEGTKEGPTSPLSTQIPWELIRYGNYQTLRQMTDHIPLLTYGEVRTLATRIQSIERRVKNILLETYEGREEILNWARETLKPSAEKIKNPNVITDHITSQARGLKLKDGKNKRDQRRAYADRLQRALEQLEISTRPEENKIAFQDTAILFSELDKIVTRLAQKRDFLESQTKTLDYLKHEYDQAIAQLTLSNLRLAVWVIQEDYGFNAFPGSGILNEAVLGLLIASKKYEVGLETRFSTYAVFWIRYKISQWVRHRLRKINVPAHMNLPIGWVQAALSSLYGEGVFDPSVVEVTAKVVEMRNKKGKNKVDIGVDEVKSILQIDRMARVELFGDDEDSDPEAEIKDTNTLSSQQQASINEFNRKFLSTLSESFDDTAAEQRKLEMVSLRFGLKSGKEMTLDAVGAQMGGISREGVRRSIEKSLARLREGTTGSAFQRLLKNLDN